MSAEQPHIISPAELVFITNVDDVAVGVEGVLDDHLGIAALHRDIKRMSGLNVEASQVAATLRLALAVTNLTTMIEAQALAIRSTLARISIKLDQQ